MKEKLFSLLGDLSIAVIGWVQFSNSDKGVYKNAALLAGVAGSLLAVTTLLGFTKKKDDKEVEVKEIPPQQKEITQDEKGMRLKNNWTEKIKTNDNKAIER